MWILAWGAEHVPRLLIGAIGWSEFWNANIFHPDPLALALSEHLFGQTLQILPVYWLTGNIILCYNLLFISTFALSAFGTYLLVRDLTGDTRAAFIAGLVYGFLPYRIASVPHLQVMSSQWMPFALWGLNRFITLIPDPGSRVPALRALALGTGALVLQNWSCGYYLLYFAPFVPLFVLHRMWTSGTLRTVRTWTLLIAAAAGTLVLSLPFLFPYQEAQSLFGIERPFGEVVSFSANAWSYLTASENLNLWGRALRFSPRPEGETFLGFVAPLLALIAVFSVVVATPTSRVDSPRLRWLKILLLIISLTQLVALASVLIFGGFEVHVLGMPIRARTPARMLFQFVAAAGLLLAVSPRMRDRAAQLVRSPVVFFFCVAVLAMWLSLGPMPSDGDGRARGFGIYAVLYDYVPGFNGVRVPARYAMIAGLFLAVLAGYGARALLDAPKPGTCQLAKADRHGSCRGSDPRGRRGRPHGDQPRVEHERGYAAGASLPGNERERPARLRAHCRPAAWHRHYRVSVRRHGLGDSIRLLLGRALEADREWLQRLISAGIQGAPRAPATRDGKSRSRLAVASRRWHHARRVPPQRVREVGRCRRR